MAANLSPVASPALDVERVRRDFPILDTVVNGHPLVYLDSAASAQRPRAVLRAVEEYETHSHANVHRGVHALSQAATAAYEGARERVRRFINARSTREIIFVRGTTEGINLVAQAWARPRLRPGDEILISALEHHANIVPWQLVREQTGCTLKVAPINARGELELEAFLELLGARARLVGVAHVSNALGTVLPVKRIIEAAHEVGAVVLIDGAQAVPHSIVDVRASGADFYVFSGHKLYGPTGIGVLYGKAEQLAAMRPYQGGGEMIGTVTLEEITYADPPHRFEAGTPPILEAIGLGAAVDWLSGLDRIAVAEHEHRLYGRVRERLAGANWLRVLGDTPGKGAILSFTVDGAHAHDVAQILDRYGIAVRAGTHCAEPLMRRFGVTSSARASFALYNTEAEADAFVEALTKTQAFFA